MAIRGIRNSWEGGEGKQVYAMLGGNPEKNGGRQIKDGEQRVKGGGRELYDVLAYKMQPRMSKLLLPSGQGGGGKSLGRGLCCYPLPKRVNEK